MKKLLIGITVVALLGLMAAPSMAWVRKGTAKGTDGATTWFDVNLTIEKYCRISVGGPIEVVVPPGESGGEGRADYEVASNFDYKVTGVLVPPATGLPGDAAFVWDFSLNGGSTDDGLFTAGQVIELTANANEPLEEGFEAVVAVHIFDLHAGLEFNDYAGSFKAGNWTGGKLTLTVLAQ